MKTDARDAAHLAKLLRLDEVTAVAVPSMTAEAARDLVRAREDARRDLMTARHRVSKLLLRQGIVGNQGKAWTVAHDGWLRGGNASSPALQGAFVAAYDAVTAVIDRRRRLDTAIEATALDSEFTPVLNRLGCFRGIGALTGLSGLLQVWFPSEL